MKVETRKTEERSKDKRNVMNGETSHDESPKDSSKRSRSRSKSPRNTLINGDLMFDAALYAPERPKRNRKKPEEEIFTPVKETLSKQAKKRKAPEKPKKPEPKSKTLVKKRACKVEDDEPPKPKRKCTQKKTKKQDDLDSDYEPEENHAKKPKQAKPTPKVKAKAVKKTTTTNESKGAKTPSKAGKKLPDKNSKSQDSDEDTDDEENHKETCLKASPSKTAAKNKKKASSKESVKPSATDTGKTTKAKERASKPKKSPSKIEIDGIEITELSDLNSSKEDDFNSSRDSLNNISTENDTSAETLIYDGKLDTGDNGAKTDKQPEKANTDSVTKQTEDSKEDITSNSVSKQFPEDGTGPTSLENTDSHIHIPSHLQSSPVAATSSSHVSPSVKTEGSSPSKADPAPLTYSSLPHNHTSTLNHPPLTSTPKSQPQQPEGEKKLPCTQPGCKYVGKSGVLLRKHLRNHGIFECAHCDFSGNQFELLESHMKEKHPTRWGRKKCRKCCRHIRIDLHDEHEASCNGVKIWKCDDCNNEFPYESTLKEHRKKHKRPTKYECELCDFKCELKNQLKTHIDSNHAELKNNHPCSKCKRTFLTQASLDTHMQLHDADGGRTSSKGDQSAKNCDQSTQGGIPCDVQGCEEKFKTQRLLNAHRKQTHKIGITATMFKCDYKGCGLEFARQAQLKKHAGVHSGERRFSCDWAGCQKTFRHNANLKIHFMQHTGEKPIHCEHCDFACRQRSSILFHMKTKHPGMPIPRTDRLTQRASPRRSTEGTGPTNHSIDEEHTQEYDLGSPILSTPVKSGSKSSESNTSSITPATITPADPKVYDFPDDDDEEAPLDLPVKKTSAKSPIRSLSEIENRLFNSSEDVTKEDGSDIVKEDSEDSKPNEDDNDKPEESSHDQSSDTSTSSSSSSSSSEEGESSKDEEKEEPVPDSKDSQAVADPPASIPASITSETASQTSSKFSEFAQEHVSDNFAANASEDTATSSSTPVETETSTATLAAAEQQPPTTEENGAPEEHEPHVENPIQGALDTTDDLDYQINGDTSDVLDAKMLQSPMSNISADMRALDMPHVNTTDSTSDLIKEADLAISSPSKKELRNDDGDSGMPPEINAEVDALIESGYLDGHAPTTTAATNEQQGGTHSSPRDSFHDVLAPPHSHVSSTHPDTPSAPGPGHYSGESGPGSHGQFNSGAYTPSYEQQPQSNVSHHTPEQDQRVPPAANFPLPEYPPLPSPASALQQQLSTTTAPSSFPGSLPPVYGLSGPTSTSPSLPGLPGYGAAVSCATSISPFRSLPSTTTTTSTVPIPSFTGSGLAPVVTSTASFLDAALTAGRSSLDLFPSSLPSVSRPDTITTSSTAVPSFSSSPYTSVASSTGRDLFGHYFPGAAPPDPMSGLSLPHPPTQDPQRSAYPPSSQPTGFQALQRSSADLLQRASVSGLPTYPGVTESLARLNPSTTQSLWMPGTDDRSRTWAQASPILMPPELDAASSLSRNPFSSTRSEYNFEAAAAAAALGKRPESTFPGVPVPQSVPSATEHRSYDPVGSYMGASSSHFGPGAAAAAAAANYAAAARGMPDYRTPSTATPDMYGRHVGAPPPPPLGLDKYYNPYSRDSMYRSSGLTAPPPPNPFMPGTNTNTPYSTNPMYQHGAAAAAAGTDAYSKYLPGSTEHRPAGADYFHQAAAPPRPPTADPYDPYRRSVLHNMMSRYY